MKLVLDDNEFRNLDYAQIKLYRMCRLTALRADKTRLEKAKIFYRDNPAHFINDWMSTFNPQVEDSILPFILFPKQIELINFFQSAYVDREDGLVDKCR